MTKQIQQKNKINLVEKMNKPAALMNKKKCRISQITLMNKMNMKK